uniref:Uncharacterized protein LOC114324964 n=1 Tax=Diabrotica virgifera virgifera TaxID=50390 RepID=A0A6P7F5F9_DIAVI
MENFEVIETTKGKPSALHAGYQYRKYRKNKEDVVTWVCVKERHHNCKGRMKTKLTDLLEVNQHTCGVPNIALLEVKKATYISKKRAREEDTPTPDIYRKEFEKLFTKGLDFVSKIPLYASRKSTLCRSRHLQTGVGPEPASSIEIDIPLEMLRLEDGQSVLCFDDTEEGERILCFSTSKAKETLETKQIFLSTVHLRAPPNSLHKYIPCMLIWAALTTKQELSLCCMRFYQTKKN